MQRKPNRPEHTPGFTFVELLVVMFIMGLLLAMAAPMFASVIRRSKLEQAAEAVMGALYRARHEAQMHREVVVVLFGDEVAKLSVQPMEGVLPKAGQIEIWTARTEDPDSIRPHQTVQDFKKWHPYASPLRLLTPQPITFQDGIRVMTGHYNPKRFEPPEGYEEEGRYNDLDANAAAFYFDFTYNTGTNKALGALRRHQIPFSRSARVISVAATPHLKGYGISHVLVFDDVTGEHLVIKALDSWHACRPRIETIRVKNAAGNETGAVVPVRLTHIVYGAEWRHRRQITKLSDLPKFVNEFEWNKVP